MGVHGLRNHPRFFTNVNVAFIFLRRTLCVCMYAVFSCAGFYIRVSEFVHFVCVSGALVVKGRVVLQ